MDELAAATASGDSINGLASHFMLDMGTYAYGNELGFSGLDFYVAGRGGVLGDAPGAVVAATFVFWEPGLIADAWERAGAVMPRAQAVTEFVGVATRWANAKLPDEFDSARLAHLAGQLADAASVAAVPLFAGWRALPEPSADDPKALCIHRMNALRELRGGIHGAAIVSAGLSAHAAVAQRTPFMLDLFGWKEPHPDQTDGREPWAEAQEATERAMAPAYGALTDAERDEFVELANAAQAAVTGA